MILIQMYINYSCSCYKNNVREYSCYVIKNDLFIRYYHVMNMNFISGAIKCLIKRSNTFKTIHNSMKATATLKGKLRINA